MPNSSLYHALVSQITTTMMVKMEKVGYPKAHQPQDQHRDPVVHTTKVTDTVLQRLQPKLLKRNPKFIKEESLFFKVRWGQTVHLQGVTCLAVI